MFQKIATNNKNISIFDYIDFRKYLGDYYAFNKNWTTYFSYRYFSEKAGFASHNVLKFIIDGQRNIADKSIDKFTKALNLSPKESGYFRLIVLFGQSTDEVDKNALFKEIFRYRQVLKAKNLEELQYRMYSEWYYVVIRELIGLKDFKDDFSAIARKFSPTVTPLQVKKAFSILEEIGIIKRNDSGHWVQCDAIVKTAPEVSSLAIRNYNRTMIDRAKTAIENVSPAEREISAMTIAISKPMFSLIKDKIQRFKDELLSDIAHDSVACDDVYQINFQLFPLLKKDRKR